MSGQELFSKGNEAFVAENYQDAIELYTKALEADDAHDEYYSNRAQAFIKLNKFPEALDDASRSLSINPQNTKSAFRQGIANYHLDNFEAAKNSFGVAKENDESDEQFTVWIQKCEDKIKSLSIETKKESTDSQGVSKQTTASKAKYDWYQTETHVSIAILLKNIKKEDLSADVEESSLSVTVKQADSADYSLELDLAHPIISAQSTVKVLNSKIEVKLKKRDGIRWQNLECENDPKIKQFNQTESTGDAMKYPSSSHINKDWDKIVSDIKKEEAEEKPEGDAALNSLFQQIYSDGNDDVKRAMNKSFAESGGTVLSTNWGEIGTKKTEIKPPDGMEYKDY